MVVQKNQILDAHKNHQYRSSITKNPYSIESLKQRIAESDMQNLGSKWKHFN